ncbi:hypothetical protein K449DRAFT_268215 [Hypoxylon sp. EC38]|nr:hypothetical protein K449DRAFT_268215 [Hypoxylon sp. EC38]
MYVRMFCKTIAVGSKQRKSNDTYIGRIIFFSGLSSYPILLSFSWSKGTPRTISLRVSSSL